MSGNNSLVSSIIAFRRRNPSPEPTRGFARLVTFGAITLGLIAVLHQGNWQQDSAAPSSAQLSLERLFPSATPQLRRFFKPETVYVHSGDAAQFAHEQTMTPSQMMARWEPAIDQAARKFKVPAQWIRAVMRQESGGRTMLAENLPIVSTAGAVGVMQVMPGTYTEMAAQYKLGADPYNPRDNIYAGAAYLNWLHKKYGYPAMFAAYNDGPGNIEQNLQGDRALPAETRGYIASIARSLGDNSMVAGLSKVALTQPDGAKVTIDAGKVTAVHEAVPGLYAPSVHAVISVGRLNRGVREDVAEATQLLRAHGARI